MILRVRHPGQPQRGRPISALGAKPRGAHRVGWICGSPSQPQQGRQHVLCGPSGFCFCPVWEGSWWGSLLLEPYRMRNETNPSGSCNFKWHCHRCRGRQAMAPGLSLLNCLQLQKLKVFALPPLSQGLSSLSSTHQPPPKIAPLWNILCECREEAWGFGVSQERKAAAAWSVHTLTPPPWERLLLHHFSSWEFPLF